MKIICIHIIPWIYGGFEKKVEENRKFFAGKGIKPVSNGIAVDLGAGTGFQSIPLAELGFSVTAVDFSKKLLLELESKKSGHNIKIIKDNILNFDSYTDLRPELIVCMGDTLTHLESIKSVEDLVKNCSRVLAEKGKLILTFRDLTIELQDENRFILLSGCDNKIFTCFLEYYPDYVRVYDIVLEKENGRWNQHISFYDKIKISLENIKTIINKSGLEEVFIENKNGLITFIASK